MIDDVFQALHARVHQAHAVALQLSVRRHQRETFRERLRDEHSIERIAMQRRKTQHTGGVLHFDGEWSKAIALDLTRDVEPARECQLSERSLDRDLPCRDDAEPHLGR
jgi:hypothetical protein